MKHTIVTTTRSRRCASAKTIISLLLLALLGLSVTLHDSSLPPLAQTKQAPLTKPISAGGWHPIHVFYGDENALLEAANAVNRTWFSQVHQDEIIIDLLGNNGTRYFIDLAANDAVDLSNTLALEKRGWEGLCIEPNPTYWFGLSHRKCTVVGALVGKQIEQVNVSFRGAYGGIVGLMDNKQADYMKEPEVQLEKRYTAPLIEVFERFHVPKVVDYLNLDVEGAEYVIMKDFPFDKYQMKLLTVERPSEELKQLLSHHGYVYLKKLVRWGETLWAHNSTGITRDHPKVQSIRPLPK